MTRTFILALTALIIGLAQPVSVKAQSAGPNYAVVNANSVNPITNTGGVQAGLGLQLTPNSSGVVRVIAHATGANSTARDGISIQIDYGTGTPPTNGDVVLPAGATAVGQRQTSISSTNGEKNALEIHYIISGLTPGTPYWFDLIEASLSGGAAQLYSIVVTAVELTGGGIAPTASLSASPTAILTGQSSTLTWGSKNAASCTGTNFSTGNATSGSVAVAPTVTTTYSVTCTGPGSSASASATVTVASPTTASLTATPSGITKGQSSTLSWSSTNATSCSGGGFSTNNATSGSVAVAPANTTTYSVTCAGAGGSASASATVTVASPAPTVSLTATPNSITVGQTSALKWSSTNATSCTGSGFNTNNVTSGSAKVSPTATTTYSVTCTGAGGSASASATVTVSKAFAVGARVVTTATVTVRSKPSTTAPTVCTEAAGSTGTIKNGPKNAQGFTWWNVAYDNGCTGWTQQTNLVLQ